MTWTKERHAEARARCEAATKGPWITGEHIGEPRALCRADDPTMSLLGVDRDGLAIVYTETRAQSAKDAALIAHARADLPDALAEIERLRGQLEGIQGIAATSDDMMVTINTQAAEIERLTAEVARLAADHHQQSIATNDALVGILWHFRGLRDEDDVQLTIDIDRGCKALEDLIERMRAARETNG